MPISSGVLEHIAKIHNRYMDKWMNTGVQTDRFGRLVESGEAQYIYVLLVDMSK